MLSLGSINFGLGVDTSGLGRSVRDVQNFGAVVDRVANQAGAGARAVEAALRRQEAATLRALEMTRKFNQETRRMNAPDTMIRGASTAFADLTNRMTSGRLSALQYQRSLEDFGVRMGNLRRELKAFEPAPAGAKFKVWLQDMTSSAVLALGPLSGVGSRITALGSIISRSSVAAAAFFTSLTAGAYAFYKLGEAAVRTSLNLDRVRSRLEGLSATPAEAYADFERLKKIAEQTGNSFTVLAEQWTNFKAASKGTSLEGEAAFQVFNDLSVAAAKFQLNGVAVEATFKALTQMMSKGTVQLEELKGQLGDQLPIAMQAAAKAMGVTTAKLIDMIRKGQVAADDFLPKFAKAVADTLGVKTTERVDTLRASLGRLDNSLTLFNDATNKAFGYSVTFKAAVEAATGAVDWMTKHLVELEMAVTVAAAALLGFASVSVLASLGRLTLAFGTLIANVRTFGIVANAIPLLRLIAVFAAVTYAITEFSDKAAEATTIAQSKFSKMVDQYIAHQNGMKTHSATTTAQLISDVQKQLEAYDIQTKALLERQNVLRAQEEWRTNPIVEGPFDLFLKGVANLGREVGGVIDEATGASTSKGDLTGLGLITYQLQRIDELAQRDKERLEALLKINNLPDSGTVNPKGTADTGKEETTAALDRRNKAIREAMQTLEALRRQQDAMAGGPAAFEAFQKQDEINNKIQAFKDRLIDAKVPLEQVNALVYKYGETLNLVSETAEGPFKAMQEMATGLKETVSGAWQSINSAFANAIVTGELNAETFVSTIQSMVARIIESIMQLSIVNPILNSLFPGNNAPAFTGQQGWGGLLTGLFGGLFGGASPSLYGRGGHIPTGQVAITGENGPELIEGPANVTPIRTGRSGSPEINVNIVNNSSSAGVSVAGARPNANGGFDLDLIVEEKVNNAIQGGKFDKANRSRYGFGSKTTKRSN